MLPYLLSIWFIFVIYLLLILFFICFKFVFYFVSFFAVYSFFLCNLCFPGILEVSGSSWDLVEIISAYPGSYLFTNLFLGLHLSLSLSLCTSIGCIGSRASFLHDWCKCLQVRRCFTCIGAYELGVVCCKGLLLVCKTYLQRCRVGSICIFIV